MAEQQTMSESKPLVIGLPGFGDSKYYSSYQSWRDGLSQLDADVDIVDMYADVAPGVTREIGANQYARYFYSTMNPNDYYCATRAAIDRRNPTETVLCGFGFGANQAIQQAFALSHRGYRIAGVVGIAPTIFFDKVEPFDGWLSNFPRKGDPVELHNVTPSKDQHDLEAHRLSCRRYRDLTNPRRKYVSVLNFRTLSVGRYVDPFEQSLFGTSGGGSGSWKIHGLNELLESEDYTLPTAFIAGGADMRVPKGTVRWLADQTRFANVDFAELPDVWHDFRARPAQYERVTETLMDKIGQVLTTRTVQKPKSLNGMLAMGAPATETRQPEVIVLSAARQLNRYGESVIQTAAETDTPLAALCSHQARPEVFASSMERLGATGVVVDFPQNGWWPPMTDGFATLEHPAVAGRVGNLSPKRNVGLTIPGDKILSDDDMLWSPAELAQMSAAFGQYEVAGFQPFFDDLSVLGHADKLAGGEREVSISGNSLGVSEAAAQDLFNDPAYNEDRNAIHNAVRRGRAVLLGQIKQAEYDPFDTPERARQQVFGEVVHEGMYFLLGADTSYREVGEDFWKFMIGYYGRQIDDVAKRLMGMLDDGDERVPRALASMRAMKAQLETYTPHAFASYVSARHDDATGRWPEAYARLPEGMTLPETMAYHGLKNVIVVGEPNQRRSKSLI